MLRTIRRAVTIVAASAAVAVAAASGASAAEFNPSLLQQMESATLINLADISRATLTTSGTSGDFTCANPVAVASPVTPAAYVIVGETYGHDAAEAVGHCMSYQGGSATATLSVWLEYQPYYGASFVPIPDCYAGTTTAPAIAGVHALVSPVVTCRYDIDSPAAGRPHRAHAVLTHSGNTARQYHGYSPVYFDSYAAHALTTRD